VERDPPGRVCPLLGEDEVVDHRGVRTEEIDLLDGGESSRRIEVDPIIDIGKITLETLIETLHLLLPDNPRLLEVLLDMLVMKTRDHILPDEVDQADHRADLHLRKWKGENLRVRVTTIIKSFLLRIILQISKTFQVMRMWGWVFWGLMKTN
jgi:hypothetical protein